GDRAIAVARRSPWPIRQRFAVLRSTSRRCPYQPQRVKRAIACSPSQSPSAVLAAIARSGSAFQPWSIILPIAPCRIDRVAIEFVQSIVDSDAPDEAAARASRRMGLGLH